MRRLRTAFLLTIGIVASAAGLAAQMPDARAMSGIPMPMADVPAGSIVVRVVRQQLSNNVAGQAVELHVGSQVLTAKTDAEGRATFAGLTSGTEAHAVAVVDGERLESAPMQIGPTGGIRVMLVAGVGAASSAASGSPAAAPAPDAPIVPGEVTLGGQSRIQIEFDDDQLEVFYLFEVVNRGGAAVAPKDELVFELPEGAWSPALLEGTSPQASLRGRTVSVSGPFAPGTTPVQVAYGLSGGAAERVLRQSLPVAWDQVQVMVTQVGNVQLASPQLASARTMTGEGGAFVLGSGPRLGAGQEIILTLSGLPYRSRAGRWVALAIALLVLLVGAWSAFGGRGRETAPDARRAQLEARRQKLMADLVKVEEQHREGRSDPGRYASRRQDLVAQLERVYGELDRHAAPGVAD
jgi:hypothetical protein